MKAFTKLIDENVWQVLLSGWEPLTEETNRSNHQT
ncbi:hypothetical protein Godav_028164 [Gossypium davidsonii]|uniref:Uncharacterized protein n=1 Tax=Gossypium davidsonii TaxID=34287 RepID=A0A7J8RYK4_GOSDV|nr:hypothetical protein [Gossypium davidsonii]